MFVQDAVAGNKMAAFVEMKVRCCSLWRRWQGDVVVGIVEMWLFQNKDRKRITANSKITARLHE